MTSPKFVFDPSRDVAMAIIDGFIHRNTYNTVCISMALFTELIRCTQAASGAHLVYLFTSQDPENWYL